MDSQIENLNGGGNVKMIVGFKRFETPDGQPLSLPLSLDSGEARTMIVYAPMLLDTEVNDALRKIVDQQQVDISKLKIDEVERLLAEQKTDLLGNNDY